MEILETMEILQTILYTQSPIGLGFVIHDPFPVVLRHLSVGYMELAWSKLQLVLQGTSVDASRSRLGWLHPGVAYVPAGRDENSPLACFGWVLLESAEDVDRVIASLGEQLRDTPPVLAIGSSYRGGYYDAVTGDPRVALTCLLAYCVDELGAWAPQTLLRIPMADDEPLSQVARALLAHDAAARQHAMETARSRYSDAGFALLTRGVERWMKYCC